MWMLEKQHLASKFYTILRVYEKGRVDYKDISRYQKVEKEEESRLSDVGTFSYDGDMYLKIHQDI